MEIVKNKLLYNLKNNMELSDQNYNNLTELISATDNNLTELISTTENNNSYILNELLKLPYGIIIAGSNSSHIFNWNTTKLYYINAVTQNTTINIENSTSPGIRYVIINCSSSYSETFSGATFSWMNTQIGTSGLVLFTMFSTGNGVIYIKNDAI